MTRGLDTTAREFTSMKASATTRSAWTMAWLASAASLGFRLPVLRTHVEALLLANAEASANVPDGRMCSLALNIGVTLAVLFSLTLLLMLQSLGRLLEARVFTPSLIVGRLRFGLFFVIATAATLPVSVYCLLTGTVTLRGSEWYVAAIVTLALLLPLLYRRNWRGKGLAKVSLLFIVAGSFGLLASLL